MVQVHLGPLRHPINGWSLGEKAIGPRCYCDWRFAIFRKVTQRSCRTQTVERSSVRLRRTGCRPALGTDGLIPAPASAPGDVAQLAEHRLCKAGVRGSSPLVSTSPGATRTARRQVSGGPFAAICGQDVELLFGVLLLPLAAASETFLARVVETGSVVVRSTLSSSAASASASSGLAPAGSSVLGRRSWCRRPWAADGGDAADRRRRGCRRRGRRRPRVDRVVAARHQAFQPAYAAPSTVASRNSLRSRCFFGLGGSELTLEGRERGAAPGGGLGARRLGGRERGGHGTDDRRQHVGLHLVGHRLDLGGGPVTRRATLGAASQAPCPPWGRPSPRRSRPWGRPSRGWHRRSAPLRRGRPRRPARPPWRHACWRAGLGAALLLQRRHAGHREPPGRGDRCRHCSMPSVLPAKPQVQRARMAAPAGRRQSERTPWPRSSTPP